MVRMKTRPASLENFDFKLNSGHNSSEMNFVNKSINVAIEYTSSIITASLDKTKPAPTISYENKVILQNAGVLTDFEVVIGNGNVVNIEENTSTAISETVNVVVNISEVALVPIDALKYMNKYIQETYLTSGSQYFGSMQGFSALWKLFIDKIDASDNPDVRLLIYRDALETIRRGTNMFIDNKRLQNELIYIQNKYECTMARLNELLQQMAHESLAQFKQYCGGIGILIKNPKPMIYAQAILNIEMAWYLYLYGSPVDPLLYISVVEYVKSLGTKEIAYAKLIILLDDKYRDDNKEWHDYLNRIDSSITQYCEEPSPCLSSEEKNNCHTSSDCYTNTTAYNTYDMLVDNSDILPGRLQLGTISRQILVVGGNLSVDLLDKFDKYTRCVKAIRCAKHKTSVKRCCSRKRNRTYKRARYMIDPLTSGLMLIVKGNLGMTLQELFCGKKRCILLTTNENNNAHINPFEGYILIDKGGDCIALDKSITENEPCDKLMIA